MLSDVREKKLQAIHKLRMEDAKEELKVSLPMSVPKLFKGSVEIYT